MDPTDLAEYTFNQRDLDDPDESSNLDFNDPMTFFSSIGMPKPSSLPRPAEVRQQALERSNKVLSDWVILRKILERHEATVRKRWMKKSKAQRKTILLSAWPGMSSPHRPDYEAFRKESPRRITQETTFRDAYMWPYINVEDLVQGKSLLLFINSRGRHPLNMFAHADYDAMRLGSVTGAINMPFLNNHTMFLDVAAVTIYGKLDAWADNDEAFEMMMSGRGFHPGEGLTILEIQQRVLEFLVKCCRLILHDLKPDSLIGDQIPVTPEPPAIMGDPAEWPTIASMAAEAPYRLPADLDLGRLKAVIAAKLSAAEDHIWGLREDPGYFADTVGDWSEHRQETLLDTNGKPHPALSNLKSLFWEQVLSNVIVDAYGNMIVWDLIYQQITELESLKSNYEKDISPQTQLPPEYMEALLSFRYMLNQASKGPILNLKTGVPSSPPFRPMFLREPQIPGSAMIRVQSKPGVKTDAMLWIFQTLWNDQQLFLCGLPSLMDELERMIQSDQQQKDRISAWVARVLSDLGVIARARHEIDIYQPWAAGMDYAQGEYDEDIKSEFARKFAALAQLESGFKSLSLAKVGIPSDGKFSYPSDRPRTQKVTEAMRKAEQNLDLFWKTVDQEYKNKTGRTLHGCVKHLFSEERELERTPQWIEPIGKIGKEAESKDSEFDIMLSQFRMDHKKDSQTEPQTLKTKVKTKGAVLSADPATPRLASQLPSHTPDTQPLITVSKRAFKVFSTLFHTPSQSNQPGEISWPDFLHAMAATGLEPTKLYGSVWQFTPTKLDVERSIQFHEPHPRGKIPFRNARRFGRRLNRAYGWYSGMFVQE